VPGTGVGASGEKTVKAENTIPPATKPRKKIIALMKYTFFGVIV
jgi:hypothetical protein